jgi:hypothetical protein
LPIIEVRLTGQLEARTCPVTGGYQKDFASLTLSEAVAELGP